MEVAPPNNLAADGDDCDAGDSDANAAASVAARLALAASSGSENAPKSESVARILRGI
jgi:hypothetical protein